MDKINNNGQLIVSNKNNELQLNFKRVDFNEPKSIMDYGEDVKIHLSEILKSTAKLLTNDEEEIRLDDDILSEIVTFQESLDESDKISSKKELAVITKIKSILSKMGVKKIEEEKYLNSYQGRYDKYLKMIEKACEAVETQIEGSLRNIELRKSTIDDMTPYIEDLKMVVLVGKEDLKTFSDEIEVLKQQEQTDEIKYEIKYKEQLKTLFNSRIDRIEKVLTLYREQINEYRYQQSNDMELVMSNRSFIIDQARILESQGSVMVYNKLQKERIEDAQLRDEIVNLAIIKNGQNLEENAQSIVEMSINGGIKAETISTLNEQLNNVRKIIEDGKIKKTERIESDRTRLEKINESLNDLEPSIDSFIGDSLINNRTISSSKVKTKRLGNSYGTKRF